MQEYDAILKRGLMRFSRAAAALVTGFKPRRVRASRVGVGKLDVEPRLRTLPAGVLPVPPLDNAQLQP